PLPGGAGLIASRANIGSSAYSYPLVLPYARGRFQPRLTLEYQSTQASGPLGVGWSLPEMFIERDMRAPVAPNGQRKLQYLLVNGGTSQPLVPLATDPGHYRVAVETSFLDFTRAPGLGGFSGWVGTDGEGTRYMFESAYDGNGAV